MVNFDFWRKKKVFITGHTGFKGAWLSYILTHFLDSNVTGYALPADVNSLFSQLDIENMLSHHEADLREKDILQKTLTQSNPDIIIHLAAQSLVQTSYQQPYETFEINVMGTLNLLESLRETGYSGITAVITSDKCYDSRTLPHAGFAESSPLGGNDPYSASKAAVEILTHSYLKSYPDLFENKLITLRAGNVIGGGDQSKNRLVPDLIRYFSQNKAIPLRNPSSIRPWQHVLEPLFAYLKVIEKMSAQSLGLSSLNIGPSDRSFWSVKQVAEYMADKYDVSPAWVQEKAIFNDETRVLTLDTRLAKDVLGWSPVLSLEKSLDWVYEWHTHSSPSQVTHLQILKFMELIL